MTGLRLRPPAVAGAFYPSDPDALRACVQGYLDEAVARAGGSDRDGRSPKAIVAPHAGYVYSGPVAARAYAAVLPLRGTVERVVLLGPAHRVPLAALAAPTADAFATPLGPVPVDTAARDRVVGAGLVVTSDEAHAREHSLEVHLPFLQVALGDVAVLPLTVGNVAAAAASDVIERVWDGSETLVVVSTDLSHYHDQATAADLDRRTAAAVVAKRPEELRPDAACGLFALRGLLEVARRHDLDVELLHLGTSADTAGTPERVVGYGAFAIA